MMEKRKLPTSSINFKEICKNNYYIDKTMLIKELLDNQAQVVLFTRPRRFGKTLNMEMLRTFFEKTAEDTSIYFRNKAIWKQGSQYINEQGKYPVIYISLKDIKADKWSNAYESLKDTIATEYMRHNELNTSTEIDEADLARFKRIKNGQGSEIDYQRSLLSLSRMLNQHHKVPSIIIIDEYDTPIQQGYVNGYYNEAVEFIRNFFSAAFKDNLYIKICILTGILRVAKESIFSGLNNIYTNSVIDKPFSTFFGFTREEVKHITEYYSIPDKLDEIKEWYDGYQFGDTEIYNPWSVISYIGNNFIPFPYWSQTSENIIIHELLKNPTNATYRNLNALIAENGEIKSIVKTNISYPRLKDPQTDILGFLLMTGYLKATKVSTGAQGGYNCILSIPNKEIKTIYYDEILSMLNSAVGETL